MSLAGGARPSSRSRLGSTFSRAHHRTVMGVVRPVTLSRTQLSFAILAHLGLAPGPDSSGPATPQLDPTAATR